MNIFIDNKGGGYLYYDGDSMGGGVVDFLCKNCGAHVNEETIRFFIRSNRMDRDEKLKLEAFFHVDVESIKKRTPAVGFLKCNICDSNYAVYISYGEIQPARYQASLISVAEI